MKKHGAKWGPNYFLLLPGHPLMEKKFWYAINLVVAGHIWKVRLGSYLDAKHEKWLPQIFFLASSAFWM